MLKIRKIVYLGYRLISSAKHWIVRRFTNAGRAVLAGMLITAVIGFDTDQTNTYQVFAFLTAFLLLSAVTGWRRPNGISITRRLPRFATVGSVVTYSIEVENRTAGIQQGLVLIEDMADPRPLFAEYAEAQIAYEKSLPFFAVAPGSSRKTTQPMAQVKEEPVPALSPRARAEVKMTVLPRHRGLLRFEGVTLGRIDLLGLVKALRRSPQAQTLMVLPKRYFISPVAFPGALRYQQGGVALASSVGESEEFVALRDYRPGDAIRHIHWRSWARTGRPIVKEFQEEFFVRHALVLDTFSPWAKEDLLEEAISVAASFACTIQTQESLLDLMFVGPRAFCFTAGRGLAHADQMLEILAVVRPCRDQPFESLERLVMQHLSCVSGCIMILLEWDEPRKNLARKLQTLGIPLLVLVITENGGIEYLKTDPAAAELENIHALEAGHVQEDLAAIWK